MTEEHKRGTDVDVKIRLNGVSDLLEHLNKESIHAIFGQSQVGKTTLMLQVLYDISDQLEMPVLYYDTEGGGNTFVELWGDIYKKRYPKAQVDVRTKRKLQNILKDHGKMVKIKYSGGKAVSQGAKEKTSGKTTIQVVDEIDPCPLGDLIAKNGYGAIFYDSMTTPMKVFGPDQQNFPARNQAQTAWFAEMLNIIDEYGVYVLAAHHASKNPADPYAKEQMTGGGAVQYYCKVILHLKKWRAKGATAYRTLKLVRYFNKAPDEHETLMKLTNEGYDDATTEQMDADKAAAKK